MASLQFDPISESDEEYTDNHKLNNPSKKRKRQQPEQYPKVVSFMVPVSSEDEMRRARMNLIEKKAREVDNWIQEMNPMVDRQTLEELVVLKIMIERRITVLANSK